MGTGPARATQTEISQRQVDIVDHHQHRFGGQTEFFEEPTHRLTRPVHIGQGTGK